MKTSLDHIVIGAANLDQGREFVREQLGVEMPVGGEHPLMATHNLLMQLGGNVFLEVIAINPDASPPSRPRWYGLDDPYVSAALADSPRLLTWVVNTNNISSAIADSGFLFGKATAVTRGNLRWNFAVPDDGRLLAGGLVPYLMQWHSAPHPAAKMADTGCVLESINISHPYAAWLRNTLDAVGAGGLATISESMNHTPAALSVAIASPKGTVTLSGIG